jgi:RNA recognition motif-containing protein
MREKGSEEREGEGSRGEARVSPFKRRGYIHNVDQASISYFVTNFPEDCSFEDLWKVFARFGRVGDVYIPKKLDKWGKRFAFVKYMEAMEVQELRQREDDVWIGTFKLRINKSRFDRRDDSSKMEEVGPRRGPVQDNVSPERSFKMALMQSSSQRAEPSKKKEDEDEVLKVEVDRRVLKELEQSFVGLLAINVEVKRIRTTLFMEGFAHISDTDMGSKMVLIQSPFAGEVERL